MISIEKIRENYSKLDDSKIIQVATNPKGLRKEVVQILNEEIKNRKLDIGLIEWVNLENDTFDGFERELLKIEITNSMCSECEVNSDLKGYGFQTVISFLISSNNTIQHRIICKDCARKIRIKSLFTTFLLGWWSRSGFFSTPFILIAEIIKAFRVEKENETIINKFIDENTGSLRILKKEKQKISILINEFNDKEYSENDNFGVIMLELLPR